MSSNSGESVTRRMAIKYMGGVAAAAVAAGAGANVASAVEMQTDSKNRVPRVAPEAVGIEPAAVVAFIAAVEEKVGGLHSFMLLRHGKVAAEGWWMPYAPNYLHELYSLSKSFTSTAIGLLVSDRKLSVDDRVVSFFPDKLPAKIDDNLSAMQVKHLLTMSTGHDKDATGPVTSAPDDDWVRQFLSLPVEHAPGSKFVYNSAATYMLSAIAQKLTGMQIVDFLKPRLFDPLGIHGQTWQTCPKGINVGGWGLSVKTEDIARFGQMYRQSGTWNGKRIVPAAWVSEATTKHISNGDPATPSDWAQGYGYQFWRCRHDAYRGDGAFGQYCVVMPEQDAVLAVTSGVGDMQAVLNAVWEHLLPGMKSGSASASQKTEMERKLKTLEVSPPMGTRESPTATQVSGKTYRLDANDEKWESAVFTVSGDGATLKLRADDGHERTIVAGTTRWLKGDAPRTERVPRLGSPPAGETEGRGAWTAPDTFTFKTCFVETPFIETTACRFDGDTVTISRKRNVGFGPTERPTLTGKRAASA